MNNAGLAALLPPIGHIQIAPVPERGTPDHGELGYGYVLAHIAKLGWTAPFGAEYLPADDMGWIARYKLVRT